MHTINCKGKLISLEEPVVMGIINATPDSFYKGDLSVGVARIVAKAEQMLASGATILDIGGQSTRPGSQRINALDEIMRVLPIIESIMAKFPDAIISIDTYHSEVARAAVAEGASMVNDISGGEMDDRMIDTVAELSVPYVCMHMKGTPATMQHSNEYAIMMQELIDYFIKKIAECKNAGINDTIIDPGFGFGKDIAQNFEILKNLELFKILERPILAGLSRKSTIYKTLGVGVDEALNGTTVLNTLALANGANILRVHDVSEALECIKLFTEYKNAPRS